VITILVNVMLLKYAIDRGEDTSTYL